MVTTLITKAALLAASAVLAGGAFAAAHLSLAAPTGLSHVSAGVFAGERLPVRAIQVVREPSGKLSRTRCPGGSVAGTTCWVGRRR